jgi:pimeloyl-ACP methyl ester carboxylesterase
VPSSKLNDVDLYYQVAGAGESLLLFNDRHHPLGFWEPRVPALTKDYQVVRFDPRGAGRTTTHRNFSVDDVAFDAVRLCDVLNVDRVVAIGNGWGGLVAQLFAQEWGRARALILCGTGEMYRADNWLSEDLDALQRAATSNDDDAWIDALLRINCAHHFAQKQPDLARVIAAEVRQHPTTGVSEFRRTPPELYWAKSAVPTLLLYGTEDRIGTREHCDDLYARIPAPCQLVTMNDAGHFLIREQTNRVLGELQRFLAEVVSGALEL